MTVSWSLVEFSRSFQGCCFFRLFSDALVPPGCRTQQSPTSPALQKADVCALTGPEADRPGLGCWRGSAPAEGSWDTVSRASPQLLAPALLRGHCSPRHTAFSLCCWCVLSHQACWIRGHRPLVLRRAWQPTPGFLPGESHGPRSLVGYSPRGRRALDMPGRLSLRAHSVI